MCKIIGVVNKNKKNVKKINQILKANLEELKSQPDGAGIVKLGEKITTHYTLDYRTVDDHLKVDQNTRMLLAHFRVATTGQVSLANVHFRAVKNRFYPAHNGIVNKFSGYDYNPYPIFNNQNNTPVQQTTDSNKFFRRLLDGEITYKRTVKLIKKTDFSGRGVVYDRLTDFIYLFSTSEWYYYFLTGAFIFSSYPLTLDYQEKKIRFIYGFPYETAGKQIKIPVRLSFTRNHNFDVFDVINFKRV